MLDEKPPENDEEQEKLVWPPSTGGYVREEISNQHSSPPGPEMIVRGEVDPNEHRSALRPEYKWTFTSTEWTPEQREKVKQLLKDIGGSLPNWEETKRLQRRLPPGEWPEDPYREDSGAE